MASGSSSTDIASSGAGDTACSYDVFLSFSGEDTRNSFTDHLYHKLIQAGIRTFRDNEEINRGEELKPEIERSIKASKASVVVLSKNYATSAWCLDELLLILQQRWECNHFVLPVFYDVDPTDVRNQKGSFAIKVKPSPKWTDQNVNQWKTALTEVANLAGHVASGQASYLETDAFKKMVNLKLLQLNFVELKGSYKHVSEDLRWLCWHGFHSEILPADLCIENLVAIDMSCSNLEVFEPPTVMNPILVNICESLGALSSLTLLHMSGCKNLFSSWEHTEPTFSFPVSLHRLFLKDCYLKCADFLTLSFNLQLDLQYLNLGNSRFKSLPCYDHLKNLRVLDLSFCSRLKYLLRLPGTLAELYIYYCESLEKITFQSHRFPLQELGYEGCVNLYEIEDYVKLVPIAKLDETDLGHLEWLKEYQNHEVCLVGDDELTVGRSWHIQMLYEFNIAHRCQI
ncbi:putative TIR domain, leucine-rich repeat domain superfamily [Helianthus annuus]|nr:putative TIR domain, leucine-rich repeat domain superfamily [Helianthus annuus]KAJ0541040.1 putative TIR domain, leucine-rich repeat domain superfamily [Helianthus annuus]